MISKSLIRGVNQHFKNILKYNKSMIEVQKNYKQMNKKRIYNFSNEKVYEKYKTIQQLEKELQNEFSYSQINVEYLQDVQKAVEYLKNQDLQLIKISIQIFLQHLFINRDKILEKIVQEQQKLKQNVQQFNNDEIDDEKQKLLFNAREIQKGLEYLLEYLDNAQMGFLSGDLSVKMIIKLDPILQRVVQELIKKQKDKNFEQIKDNILKNSYKEIQKNVFDQNSFNLPENGIKYPNYENPKNLFERELIIEEQSNQMAIDSFTQTFDNMSDLDLTYQLQFSQQMVKKWFPKLFLAIQEEQKKCLNEKLEVQRKQYAKYLLNIKAEQLTILCLSTFMKKVLKCKYIKNRDDDEDEQQNNKYVLQNDDEQDSIYVVNADMFSELGKSINQQFVYEQEIHYIQQIKKTKLQVYQQERKEKQQQLEQEQDQQVKEGIQQQLRDIQNKIGQLKKLKAKYYMKQDQKQSQVYEQREINIPKKVQLLLGSVCSYLMNYVMDINGSKVFKFGYANQVNNHKSNIGVMILSNVFLNELDNQIAQKDDLFNHLERSLPMIYKPAKWIDYEIGGYYLKPTNLMRIQEHSQEVCLKNADLQRIFEVLDTLAETPWKINKEVLEVMEKLWQQGGGKAALPIKTNIDNYRVYNFQVQETEDQQLKKHLKREIKQQKDNYSISCDFNLKLNVAKSYKDVNRIYFPHNLDFRGRVYPIAPHLNHMGHDISRGLLLFAKGENLGKNGFYWLKIHLANQMGKDKLSFQQRIEYIDENVDYILQMANEPMVYREWMDYENCWQALAGMFELRNALKSKDVSKYVSHLHIHVDGTCNGLQHYAALGRDIEGAQQVNLTDSSKPSDIYTYVANMVQQKLQNDLNNIESDYHKVAQILNNNIKRKTVKQTVMTSVYGVTFIGAKMQIKKQLQDKPFIMEHENSDSILQQASHYLATLTLLCIKDLFQSAHEIKKWLRQCAMLISNQNHCVKWISPLGLPCIQPYRSKNSLERIQTLVQDLIVYNQDQLGINKNKQTSAFPPNFIHSLDSTHMMYTAIQCKTQGITFAAVHDSYWTHASKVDAMNNILREQFVHLHSQPLLEDLRTSFEIRYPLLKFPTIPERGEFDLKGVLRSQYFFA